MSALAIFEAQTPSMRHVLSLYGRRVVALLGVFGFVLGLVFAGTVVQAAPASADVVGPIAVDPTGVPTYGVDVTEACRLQYPAAPGIGAAARYLDPYSWVCTAPTTVTNSSGVSAGMSKNGPVTLDYGTSYQNGVLGGVNLNRWCGIKHPYTHAELHGTTADSWVCATTPA